MKLSKYLMQQKFLIAFALICIASSKLVAHGQVASGFACCPDTYIFDERTLSCVCPASTPYVDASGKCVSCNAPSYWDSQQNACLTCPSNTVYDKAQNKCNCPSTLPYVDASGKCVACAAPGFWNPNTLTCLRCGAGFVADT